MDEGPSIWSQRAPWHQGAGLRGHARRAHARACAAPWRACRGRLGAVRAHCLGPCAVARAQAPQAHASVWRAYGGDAPHARQHVWRFCAPGRARARAHAGVRQRAPARACGRMSVRRFGPGPVRHGRGIGRGRGPLVGTVLYAGAKTKLRQWRLQRAVVAPGRPPGGATGRVGNAERQGRPDSTLFTPGLGGSRMYASRRRGARQLLLYSVVTLGPLSRSRHERREPVRLLPLRIAHGAEVTQCDRCIWTDQN